MSRSASVLLVLAVLAGTVLTACGSDDSGSSTVGKAAATSAPASTETAPAAPAKDATVVAKCHAVLDRYVTLLHTVRGTLDGTPEFKSYNAAVGKSVDAFYSSINSWQFPSTSCGKTVGEPVILAYKTYVLATQVWTECRQRQRCAAVRPELKRHWTDAGAYLTSADNGFSSVTVR